MTMIEDPYPVVDDRSEIETGEVFLVQVKLNFNGEASSDPTEWYLPAVAVVTEEGTTMTPCDTKIWTQGWAQIDKIKVSEDTDIRYVPDDVELVPAFTGNEHSVIADCWEGGISDCLELCGDVLLADSKAFAKYLKGSATSVSFDVLKWNYLKSVMLKLSELTLAEWKCKRPSNPEKMTETEKAFFKDEYLTPILGEHQALQKDSRHDVLKHMKTSVNMKYIISMMDMAVSDDGPLHEVDRKAKDRELGRREASNADISQMMEVAKECMAANKVLTAQLKLRAQVETIEIEDPVVEIEASVEEIEIEDPGSVNQDKAEEFKICPDHNCFFQLVQVFGDKIDDPNCELELSPAKVALAKAQILFQAKAAYEKDASEFMALHEEKDYEEYYVHITAPATSENWGGQPEAGYYTAGHPSLELRTLKLISKDHMLVTSTLREGEKAREWVGFGIFDACDGKEQNGHYNAGTILKENGVTCFLFRAGDEAKAAQTLLEAMMRKKTAKKKKQVHFAPPQSKEDFIQNTVSVIMGRNMEPPAAQHSEVQIIDRQVCEAREAEKRRSNEQTAAAMAESARLANVQTEVQQQEVASNERIKALEWIVQEQQKDAQHQQQTTWRELLKVSSRQESQQQWLQAQQQAQPQPPQQQQQQQQRQNGWQPQQQFYQQQMQPQQQVQPQHVQQQQDQSGTGAALQQVQLRQQQGAPAWGAAQQQTQPQHAQQQVVPGWGAAQQQRAQQQGAPGWGAARQQTQPQHAQQQGAPGWGAAQQQVQPQHVQQQQGAPGWGGPSSRQQPQQRAQQQQSAPGGRGASPPPERQDPVVVVFGSGEKKSLKELMKRLSPNAFAAVAGVQQVITGAPRCLIFAKASNAALVQTLIPLLERDGINAAVYKNMMTGQPPKAQVSSTGLAAANAAARVCNYYGATPRQICPWGDRCKFTCWGGQPRN